MDNKYEKALIDITIDEDFAEILGDASLPALLPALAQATGDFRLIDKALMPKTGLVGATLPPQGGMSAEAQVKARKLATEALANLRDGKTAPIDLDADDGTVITRLMEFITGKVDKDYVPLLRQELGISDESRPDWTLEASPSKPSFRVAVIGAGMSGLAAAYRLAQASVEFVVFESNDDVGGTWLNNVYPGCRLDTSNFGYSYSYAQKADWEQQFSDRDSIYQYFKDLSVNEGLEKYIRFSHTVSDMIYNDRSHHWTLTYKNANGETKTETFNAVISAVGQLNVPSIPKIAGQETFSGAAFHTAEWDPEVKLKGKRVAVIGTGASAAQVIPAIADQVSKLYVFQRTPTWFNPTPSYLDKIPEGLRWLLINVPYYDRWFRFYQFWRTVEGRRPYMQVDPDWEHPVSLSAKNEELRSALEDYLLEQFRGEPELIDKVVPKYPPGAKRMPRDDGSWASTLKKDHVELINERISRISPDGIVTESEQSYEVDVIIYGTGFKASEFLSQLNVKGLGGVDLQEYWNRDAKAYLGITIPNFPNMFCLYGPNTNLIFNGSLVIFSECGTNYTMQCIKSILDRQASSIEVKQRIYDEYNEMIDRENSRMVWGAATVNSWYKNSLGRVSQNWPLPSLEYWRMTRYMEPADYTFHTASESEQ